MKKVFEDSFVLFWAVEILEIAIFELNNIGEQEGSK